MVEDQIVEVVNVVTNYGGLGIAVFLMYRLYVMTLTKVVSTLESIRDSIVRLEARSE